MSYHKVTGTATVIRYTKIICRVLTKMLPKLSEGYPEPERTLLLALHAACSNLLEEYPNIGYD